MIQARRLEEDAYRGGLDLARDQKGNNDLLNLTQPDVIREIAEAYIAAGADVLATNSFNANRISQADYGAEHLVADINRAGAAILRKAVDAATIEDGRRRFVVGAVGPTNKTLPLYPTLPEQGSPAVDFDDVQAA